MFEKGSWVQSKVDKLNGFVDYSNTVTSTVCFVSYGSIVRTQNVSNGNIHKLGNALKPDELFELINMALLMRDRDWFVSLSNRLRHQTEKEVAE